MLHALDEAESDFSGSSGLETRFVDLLAGAFEAFPDREYAVVTQPFAAPDIPLLRRFVQVPPVPSSTLPQTLFVCHRDSLVAPALTTVRRAGLHDRATIRALAASFCGLAAPSASQPPCPGCRPQRG